MKSLLFALLMSAGIASASVPDNSKYSVSNESMFENKSQIQPTGISKLDYIINTVKQMDVELVVVVVYDINEHVATKKAVVVANYMISKGIEHKYLFVQGKHQLGVSPQVLIEVYGSK